MVKVNGFMSEAIPILSGVRQGDPLSALLFVMVIEILAILMRKNINVRGVKLPGMDFLIKILLYADDTAIPLETQGSLGSLQRCWFCIVKHQVQVLTTKNAKE